MRQSLRRARNAVLAAAALALAALPANAQSLIRDAEIERTLGELSAPLFSAAGLSPSTVDIFIISDPGLNAFVAGGRNVFLNTGLITRLETPEALQGVIAHEAGHIAGGHLARRAIRFRSARGPALIGTVLGIAAAVAGSPSLGAAITSGSQNAILRDLLRYNRGEEASADQAALAYMVRAGVDPQGLLDVMELFRGQEVFTAGNLDPYLLTHPLSTDRVQFIRDRVAATRDRRFVTSDETAYWHRRMQVKLEGFLERPERVLDRYEGDESEAATYARAAAYHRLPDPPRALAAADRLIALRPNDPFYAELKGQFLHETGAAEEAVTWYRRAVALAPGEPQLVAGLGRALLALNTPGANAEALKTLEAARAEDAFDARTLRDLALAYGRAGDDGMATLATAERFALSGDTETATLHARRASALLPNGSPGWLRAQDILALDPDRG